LIPAAALAADATSKAPAAAAQAASSAPQAFSSTQTQKNKDSDADFKKKLITMLTKTDKSITLIREQIVQNQSAPFLGDLYLPTR